MKHDYVKPEIKLVSLQNSDSIANTCWGNQGKSYKYYDTAGAGFIRFNVAGGLQRRSVKY